MLLILGYERDRNRYNLRTCDIRPRAFSLASNDSPLQKGTTVNYEIVTDTGCNLPGSMIDELGLHILSLTFMDEDGNQNVSYEKGVDKSGELKAFYDNMRAGKVYTTSLPSLEVTTNVLKGLLDQGRDILYLGFSSGISGTCQATQLLMAQFQGQYPERKLISVNTYAASMGQGLLVYYACKLAKSGASIEEVAQWVEDHKQNLAHWFTVEDLIYLFRGGRVSRSSAWAGNLLNIKPVLHVDDEGKLIPMEKVRGRKKSLNALVSHMEKTYLGPEEYPVVMISHGDCPEDVEYVAGKIREKWAGVEIVTNFIDPVIGAHAGPGTVALFYMATSKN